MLGKSSKEVWEWGNKVFVGHTESPETCTLWPLSFLIEMPDRAVVLSPSRMDSVVVGVLDGGIREVVEVKLALLDMRNSCCLRNAESLRRGCFLHPFSLILLF